MSEKNISEVFEVLQIGADCFCNYIGVEVRGHKTENPLQPVCVLYELDLETSILVLSFFFPSYGYTK